MAKDPAVLFYTSDFLVGTALMPDDQKGRYMTLLCLQHNQGRLSKEDFFSVAKETDKKLIDKFLVDNNGMYYNERMELESNRRKKFTDSRKKNALGKANDNASATHTDKRMENENVNEDINLGKGKEKKHKYGEYKHVLLTDDQHSKLLSEWGKDLLDDMIRKLDEGIQNKGYKYKDHNLTLRNWYKRDAQNSQTPKQDKSRQWQHRTCTACYRDLLDEETECPVCGGKDFC